MPDFEHAAAHCSTWRPCRLEVLDLAFCGRGFGDPVAAALAGAGPLPTLKRLRLAGAYRLSPTGLLKALGATPSLTELAVPHCMRLEGPEVLAIAQALPHLTKVDFSGCRGMEGGALAEGLKAMKNLEAVHLGVILLHQSVATVACYACYRSRTAYVCCACGAGSCCCGSAVWKMC